MKRERQRSNETRMSMFAVQITSILHRPAMEALFSKAWHVLPANTDKVLWNPRKSRTSPLIWRIAPQMEMKPSHRQGRLQPLVVHIGHKLSKYGI